MSAGSGSWRVVVVVSAEQEPCENGLLSANPPPPAPAPPVSAQMGNRRRPGVPLLQVALWQKNIRHGRELNIHLLRLLDVHALSNA